MRGDPDRRRTTTPSIAAPTAPPTTTLITSAGLHYSPDELEFYLVDFKKGVEFKSYVTNRLPHARVIAIESERGDDMMAAMLRRGCQAIRDLGTLDLIAAE